MTQDIKFTFILQYLEFSLKQDLQQYEVSIFLKRGASQKLIEKLVVKNPERTMTICRLHFDNLEVKFSQKMIYKDGEYTDYNVKFLFYLAGNQLIGDCVINLAYFLNGLNQDQKIKKPLTSTTDKKAALFFKMALNQDEQPQVQVPIPVQTPHQNPPQTARNSSTRKMEFPTRATRARSQSPPKEFKTTVSVNKIEEPPRDNLDLTEKLAQLGEKFQQEKLQQSVPPPPEEPDNFKEITALLSQQEEELQQQINQLDNHIKSEGKLKKVFNEGMVNHFNMEQEWKQKYQDLEEKYNKIQDENAHLKRIIRQQSEQLRRQPNQQSQANYRQLQAEQSLNQSTASNQEQYEKAIEKKNQTIQDLSNQVLELQKNSNVTYVQQLKSQILRLEQTLHEREEHWLSQEKIYQDKICKLLQE